MPAVGMVCCAILRTHPGCSGKTPIFPRVRHPSRGTPFPSGRAAGSVACCYRLRYELTSKELLQMGSEAMLGELEQPWQLPARSRPFIKPACSGVPRKRGMAADDHLIRMPSVFRIMEPWTACY